ncbi:NLR family CARD domain-containing protein 4 [Holothuria leucospilota]|uniref:NLR family CARD domain-containing protein 4 n=1 Tax=Holothuria leucospilota TaxID=206669 RepID=A0A9Q1CRF3_HOLLE|nr:NLR family CARD domain-containing protein 4 [Holothuria leucospilota]
MATESKEVFLRQLKEHYHSLYNAVLPVPYVRDRMQCVGKVYVGGGIELLTFHEDHEIWKQVDSYQDILSDVPRMPQKRILEGEAGSGKSILSLQLVYDWCNNVEESLIKDVEIVLFLRLRQLRGIKSIFKAIKLFCLPKFSKFSEREIKGLINGSRSVVMILDGFDEYQEQNSDSDVMKVVLRKMFQTFDVIVTSRYMPKQFSSQSKRCRLTGFNENARDEYLRKVVVGNNAEAAERIKFRLRESFALSDLCKVPLFFVMFAHLTYEQEGNLKLNTVTSFFREVIKGFVGHFKNKMESDNVPKQNINQDHRILSKLAFEGLQKKKQQLSWTKQEMCDRIGEDVYNQYLRIGILVEKDVERFVDISASHISQTVTEVTFYHRLFCEWYAAHYLSDYAAKPNVRLDHRDGPNPAPPSPGVEGKDILENIDPLDTEYLYRFACGLNPEAAWKIDEYMTTKYGGEQFQMLCMIEKPEDPAKIRETLEQFCSGPVMIDRNHKMLQQKSTIQLLEILSDRDIPISSVWICNCFSRVDLSRKGIVLTSGLTVTNLRTLESIEIWKEGGQVTDAEFTQLLEFAKECPRLKKLNFVGYRFFTGISPELAVWCLGDRRWTPYRIRVSRRDFRKRWRTANIGPDSKETAIEASMGYLNFEKEDMLRHLDPIENEYVFRFASGLNSEAADKLDQYMTTRYGGEQFAMLCVLEQSGKTEKVLREINKLGATPVMFHSHQSKLQHQATVKLLQIAANENYPISSVWIYDSFQSVDLFAKTIDLRSGIAFPVLQTLACLEFREKDKKFSESEVTDIIAFSSLCPNLNTLKFVYCLMPRFTQIDALSSLLARNAHVLWDNDFGPPFEMNLTKGEWQNDNGPLTDAGYQDEIIFEMSRLGLFAFLICFAVRTTVKPVPPHPVIEQCGYDRTVCFAEVAQGSGLNCSIQDSRPGLELDWMIVTANGTKNITSNTIKTSNGVLTTSSVQAENPFAYTSILSLLLCKSNNIPWLLVTTKSFILIQNDAKGISIENAISKQSKVNSRLELKCTDNDLTYLVWKYKDGNDKKFNAILYGAFIKDNFTISEMRGFELDDGGSLVISEVKVENEGYYGCVYGNGTNDDITVYEVAVFVPPNPAYPVVDGCNPGQYCVLEVQRQGILTCTVRGIRPKIKLMWQTFYESSSTQISFSDQETTVTTNEDDTFDVSVTAHFNAMHSSNDKIRIECKVPDTKENIFRLSSKLDLLFVPAKLMKARSLHNDEENTMIPFLRQQPSDEFKVDDTCKHLILTSGFKFPKLRTLKALDIRESGKIMTEKETVGILSYCTQCDELKTLKFMYTLPPRVVSVESLNLLQQREVKVIWDTDFSSFSLDLISGVWQTEAGPVTDLEYQEQDYRVTVIDYSENATIQPLRGDFTITSDTEHDELYILCILHLINGNYIIVLGF